MKADEAAKGAVPLAQSHERPATAGLFFLLGVLAVAATLFPRWVLLGGFPATDEGVYAYQAQVIHHALSASGRLPSEGTLAAYPMALSWVFATSWNPILVLRAIDLLVACCASWMFYRLLAQQARSGWAGAAIAATFLFAMNQPAFIQHGFKNSMFAAYVPLFAAARIALAAGGSDRRWIGVGVLVALSVALRESFVVFALYGLACIAAVHGRRAAAGYVVGGLLGALPFALAVALGRAEPGSLLEGYQRLAAFFDAFDADRWPNLGAAIATAWTEASFGFAMGAAGLVAVAWLGTRAGISVRLRLFWCGAAALAFVEPIAKLGFPYHVSVALPPLAVLAALGWRACRELPRPAIAAVAVLVVACAVGLAWDRVAVLQQYRAGRAVDPVAALTQREWPASAIARSNYLLLAAAARAAAPPDGTLSVTTAMLALFPLSGLSPPSPVLADLNAAALRDATDAQRLRERVRSCPPDVIMVSTRELPGRAVVIEAMRGLAEYQPVARVETSRERDYGIFGGTIYRRSGSGQPGRTACPAGLRFSSRAP